MENETKAEMAVNERAVLAILGALGDRLTFAGRAGLSYGGKRDIYEALGYPKTLQFIDYYSIFRRQDIAKRIITIKPDVAWRYKPEITEIGSDNNDTAFEVKWQEIATRLNIFHYLHKVDTLARIGEFGVLFLGFKDVNGPEQEVTRATDLLYINCFHQGAVKIERYEEDTKKPRYGLPLMYEITLELENGRSIKHKVHYSRIIHVAEGAVEGETIGVPALEDVFNRLMNLELILGGSAEMFWRGGFPGMNFNALDGARIEDADKLHQMIEEYLHGLKRYTATEGIEAKVLPPAVANPDTHIEKQLDMIACATGIPKRILIGSERGELASSQDERGFLASMEERRTNHVEARIVRPVIDRLIQVQLLPTPTEGYSVTWPPLVVLGEKDKADIAQIRATTLSTYANSLDAQQILPPDIFLEEIMGFDRDTIDRIEEEIEEEIEKDTEPEVEDEAPEEKPEKDDGKEQDEEADA
jgi:hypothetical protein